MTSRPKAPCACLTGLLAGLTVLAVVASAPMAGAQSSLLGEEYVETLTTTIGSDGTLYRVQSGIHLDLFPEDPTAGWSHVLALDVVRDGALTERVVIPGTEGPDVESSAAVVFDHEQLFVLWQSRASANRSFLDLIQFTPATAAWGDVIEVSGDPLPVKGPPQLAITRETLSASAPSAEPSAEEGSAEPATGSEAGTRTVVHVLWWESAAPGELQVLYTPIVLTDGAFLGWNPVVALDPANLPTSDAGASSTEFASDLLRAAKLDRGTDPRSVVIALPSGESGKLHNLIVRLLPDSLVDLAEHARSSIVGVGLINVGDVGDGGPPDLIDIAEYARSSIVGVGRIPLHRGVREYVGGRVFSRIVEYQALYESDAEAFWAEVDSAVWDEVLESGASILGNQLQNEDLPCGILHLGEGGLVSAGSEAAESVHQFEFCVGSEFPLPTTATEAGQEHHLLLSESATEAVVAWRAEDGSVRYRQTQDGAWSAPLTVPDSDLSLAEALKILNRKVRTH